MSGALQGSRTGDQQGVRPGYARIAGVGTRWATAQTMLNKAAMALAMIIVARALDPAEYGMASVVLVASCMVAVLPIPVIGDVLISHQHHLRMVERPAAILTAWASALLVVLAVVTAPWIASWYEHYPFTTLALLLAFSALRPVGEALSVVPLTRLRLALRYREIAVITGVTQLASSVAMVAWALVSPGAAAIVVPQVSIIVARALWLMAAARRGPASGRHRGTRQLRVRSPALASRIRRSLYRDFLTAALGQYVHTMVSGLSLLIASLFVSEDETGQLGFAIALVGQPVAIISSQLGTVLQPIFGLLKREPERQMRAFMRVLRLMTALTVPLSLLQAALAEPLIRLFFGEKWLPAVPMFVALSLAQATSLVLGPTLALLKAQGRFGTNFLWQSTHAVICLVVFPGTAIRFGATGVAVADSVLWTISILAGVAIVVHGAGVPFSTVLKAFGAPWLTAGPIALATWIACREMPGTPLSASIASLVLVGPPAMALSILAIRIGQPEMAAEIAPLVDRVLGRVPVVGRSISRWFGSSAGEADSARQ